MGEFLLIGLVYRSCLICMNGRDTFLMVLDIIDFDVILGMDWLASCHSTVDYHMKTIQFELPCESPLVFKSDSYLTPTGLVSSLSAMHLLGKEY